MSTSPRHVPRLLALVRALAKRREIPIAQLCGELGVSERELREDIELLSLCGLPPYGPESLIDIQLVRDRVRLSNRVLTPPPLQLSDEEAARRLEKYGRNALEEAEEGDLRRFLRYFWGPIPWMIELAAGLSALIGHWADFAIIGALLLYNAVSGFWQERKASDDEAQPEQCRRQAAAAGRGRGIGKRIELGRFGEHGISLGAGKC